MEIKLTLRHVHFESFKAIPPYAVLLCIVPQFTKILTMLHKHNSSIQVLQMSSKEKKSRCYSVFAEERVWTFLKIKKYWLFN